MTLKVYFMKFPERKISHCILPLRYVKINGVNLLGELHSNYIFFISP